MYHHQNGRGNTGFFLWWTKSISKSESNKSRSKNSRNIWNHSNRCVCWSPSTHPRRRYGAQRRRGPDT